MKKSIFTILCSALFNQYAYSQQVYFDYDNSGNRVYRCSLEVGALSKQLAYGYNYTPWSYQFRHRKMAIWSYKSLRYGFK